MKDYIFELQYSPEYASFIMANGDPSERVICDGDTLTDAMEDGYLFSEYLASIGVSDNQ